MLDPSKPAKSPLVLLVTLSILVVATLVVASSYFLRPSIEQELKRVLTTRFSNVGLTQTVVNISGRDVVLNGVVKDQSEAKKAELTAKETWGVRQVDNQLLIKN